MATFRDNSRFRSYLLKINKTFLENREDLHIVMSI